MLNIAKLGPGSADYYLREVTGSQACYLGAGEALGRGDPREPLDRPSSTLPARRDAVVRHPKVPIR